MHVSEDSGLDPAGPCEYTIECKYVYDSKSKNELCYRYVYVYRWLFFNYV